MVGMTWCLRTRRLRHIINGPLSAALIGHERRCNVSCKIPRSMSWRHVYPTFCWVVVKNEADTNDDENESQFVHQDQDFAPRKEARKTTTTNTSWLHDHLHTPTHGNGMSTGKRNFDNYIAVSHSNLAHMVDRRCLRT